MMQRIVFAILAAVSLISSIGRADTLPIRRVLEIDKYASAGSIYPDQATVYLLRTESRAAQIIVLFGTPTWSMIGNRTPRVLVILSSTQV